MKTLDLEPINGKWYKYPDDEDISFHLRPFSVFSMNQLPNEGDDIKPQEMLPIFQYSVLDWKGLVDKKGKKIPCTEENKKIIFEYIPEITTFVLTKSTEMRYEILGEEEVKN